MSVTERHWVLNNRIMIRGNATQMICFRRIVISTNVQYQKNSTLLIDRRRRSTDLLLWCPNYRIATTHNLSSTWSLPRQRPPTTPSAWGPARAASRSSAGGAASWRSASGSGQTLRSGPRGRSARWGRRSRRGQCCLRRWIFNYLAKKFWWHFWINEIDHAQIVT